MVNTKRVTLIKEAAVRFCQVRAHVCRALEKRCFLEPLPLSHAVSPFSFLQNKMRGRCIWASICRCEGFPRRGVRCAAKAFYWQSTLRLLVWSRCWILLGILQLLYLLRLELYKREMEDSLFILFWSMVIKYIWFEIQNNSEWVKDHISNVLRHCIKDDVLPFIPINSVFAISSDVWRDR